MRRPPPPADLNRLHGWDFPLSAHWVVRPIFYCMRGTVVSDLMLGRWWINNNTNADLSFLDGGRLKAIGVATTRYLGNETDVGPTQMSALGFGLELDSSARDVIVTRLRAVVRYKFGPDTRGWTFGLAASF